MTRRAITIHLEPEQLAALDFICEQFRCTREEVMMDSVIALTEMLVAEIDAGWDDEPIGGFEGKAS